MRRRDAKPYVHLEKRIPHHSVVVSGIGAKESERHNQKRDHRRDGNGSRCGNGGHA